MASGWKSQRKDLAPCDLVAEMISVHRGRQTLQSGEPMWSRETCTKKISDCIGDMLDTLLATKLSFRVLEYPQEGAQIQIRE